MPVEKNDSYPSSHLDQQVENKGAVDFLLHPENLPRQQQMSRAGNGNEFSKPLNCTQQYGLNEIHAMIIFCNNLAKEDYFVGLPASSQLRKASFPCLRKVCQIIILLDAYVLLERVGCFLYSQLVDEIIEFIAQNRGSQVFG